MKYSHRVSVAASMLMFAGAARATGNEVDVTTVEAADGHVHADIKVKPRHAKRPAIEPHQGKRERERRLRQLAKAARKTQAAE